MKHTCDSPLEKEYPYPPRYVWHIMISWAWSQPSDLSGDKKIQWKNVNACARVCAQVCVRARVRKIVCINMRVCECTCASACLNNITIGKTVVELTLRWRRWRWWRWCSGDGSVGGIGDKYKVPFAAYHPEEKETKKRKKENALSFWQATGYRRETKTIF